MIFDKIHCLQSIHQIKVDHWFFIIQNNLQSLIGITLSNKFNNETKIMKARQFFNFS